MTVRHWAGGGWAKVSVGIRRKGSCDFRHFRQEARKFNEFLHEIRIWGIWVRLLRGTVSVLGHHILVLLSNSGSDDVAPITTVRPFVLALSKRRCWHNVILNSRDRFIATRLAAAVSRRRRESFDAVAWRVSRMRRV